MKSFWIRSPKYDWWWFIAPMAIPPVIVFFLPSTFTESQKTEIFPWSWILIVLSIDVAHVYSTVYKTYFKPQGWQDHRLKMIVIPILTWMAGIMAYSISVKLFWTLLAYFAVFHFIRQQYGFFRLYSRKSLSEKWLRRFLNLTIYAVTVIPILIWHARGQQNFNWLTAGDFMYINLPALVPFLNVLLALILLLYSYAEYREKQLNGSWNTPRMLLTFATGFSYYVSVVLTNNDFIFSLVNVIGHGIPYLALVWYSEKRVTDGRSTSFLQYIFSKWGWILFYVIVFGMAYFEETIWDVFVYREHPDGFGWLYSTFEAVDDEQILTLLVPLLIMPQVVHYILDGYIWKKKHTEDLTSGNVRI